MGAVLGKRLAQIIVTVTNMEKNSVTFWTDSACVLYWIREHSKKLKPFVTNRISKIQMKTTPDQWRHVPTKMNPADYVTRGVFQPLIKCNTTIEYVLHIPKQSYANEAQVLQNSST